MPISAPGSKQDRKRLPESGFTLIELMVVLAIVAIGAALVTLAIRDPAETRLDQEAARLVALLETARTEARAGGLDAMWVPAGPAQAEQSQPAEPFRFVGLPPGLQLPTRWLDDGVSAQVIGATVVTLGPEAILPPQRIVLRLSDRRLDIGSDGLAAFAVVPQPDAAPQ